MIIVDFSQIAYAAIHATTKKGAVDESFLRHLVLSSILHIQRKHSRKYGDEIVLACDGRHCWRYEYFPLYKWARRHSKPEEGLDWNAIHSSLNAIQQEIKEHFKYIVIKIDEAEGDDVISNMAYYAHSRLMQMPIDFGGLVLDGQKAFAEQCPTLIVSSDKDYGQLGHIADQYDPKKKLFITSQDPDNALRYLILNGDVGDGVPNILSDDDVFTIKGKKQKSITKKKLIEWNAMTEQELKDSDPAICKNWERNNTLVNLRDSIPPEIGSRITKEFVEQEGKKSVGLMDYFFKNHLHKLMQDIQEFQ